MSNYPAISAFTRFPEPDEDYYSEADLDAWYSRIITEAAAFIEASYRKEFGDSVPDLNMQPIADALHDGVQDATARFFTEINGGDL